MICIKCKTENRIKANYCSHCGHPFTDAERNDAYAKTIYGRFEKLEDLWKTVSLDKITGSAVVKVLSLVAVLVFGGYSVLKNGTQFRPLEHESYELQYNQKVNEYYLISQQDNIQLQLYLPKQADEVTIVQLDENDQLLSTETFSLSEEIILLNQSDVLYQVEAENKMIQIRTFKK